MATAIMFVGSCKTHSFLVRSGLTKSIRPTTEDSLRLIGDYDISVAVENARNRPNNWVELRAKFPKNRPIYGRMGY